MFSSNPSSKNESRGEKRPSYGIPGDTSLLDPDSYSPSKRPATAASLLGHEMYVTPAEALALARLPPKQGNGAESSTLFLNSSYFPVQTSQIKPNATPDKKTVNAPAPISVTVAATECLEDPRMQSRIRRLSSSRSSTENSSSPSPLSSPLLIAEEEEDNTRRRSISGDGHSHSPLTISVNTVSSEAVALKQKFNAARQMPALKKPGSHPYPTGEHAKFPQMAGGVPKIKPRSSTSHASVTGSGPAPGPGPGPTPARVPAPEIKPDGLNATTRPHFEWIHSQPLSQISLTQLSMWKKLVTDETPSLFEPIFCDATLYSELIKQKMFYHTKLTSHQAQSSRARLNQFERIDNGIFQNRAGMKLANIDADLNFFLSNPRRPDNSPAIGPRDILNFADICGGPGGFSEYMLYRRGFEAKGFGITLRDRNLDFNLGEFQAGPRECFEIFYGDSNNGDIYDPANAKSFIDLILLSTDKQGVHLALADGGIEVKGEECLKQENLCKSLYLSQFLIALSVLADGGMFVCKLFETNTKFSVGLIYLLHLCFDQMTIYKPQMSRPQNSERYIVCLNKRPRPLTEPVAKYLTECHQLMWEWKTKESPLPFDIAELVPMEILLHSGSGAKGKGGKDDSSLGDFCLKMQQFNYVLMRNQIEALQKLRMYVNDPFLQCPGQDEMRVKCCEEWRIPLQEERRGKRRDRDREVIHELTDETFNRLWHWQDEKGDQLRLRDLKERKLTLSEFDDIFQSPFDWRVVVVQGNGSTFRQSRGFYMSQGGSDVFRYNVTRDEWEEAPITIELPKDTLVFGECVQEFEGYGPHQKKIRVFHIIDALVINGKDLRNHHYIVRHEFITKLARAVSKGSRGDLSIVRAKQLVRMENIADVLDKCTIQALKGETGEHWTCPIDYTDKRSPLIKAAGILFLKLTKDPWIMQLNDKNHRKYWLNLENGTSTYDFTPLAVSSFIDTMEERTMWTWTEETSLEVPDPELGKVVSIDKEDKNPDIVHSYHFLEKEYSRPQLRLSQGHRQGP